MSKPLIAEKYQLIRRLAQGGVGEIWLGRDTALGRSVAVKVLKPTRRSSYRRERFQSEARLVAQLQSQHIVQIFDFGFHGDKPFMVMELLQGEDLHQLLERVTRVPVAQVASIIDQVAIALSQAHQAGIVHGDLKPGNIFLAQQADEQIVKVLDFGAAIAGVEPGEEQASKVSAFVGTPLYMSPEQLRRKTRIDHRSDLWSLAIVAYRLLTGSYPFYSDRMGELILGICTDEAVPLSRLRPDLSPDFDSFFSVALAKDPVDRFQSAKALAAAFRTTVREESQSATKVRVLVVDDEPDMPMLIKQRFRRRIRASELDFVFAANGQEALELVEKDRQISVVLTDINMPVMDGLRLLSHLTEMQRNLEVVVVSAYGDMKNIRVAMNRGAFDFLVKPIDFSDLNITIDKAIRHVERRQSLSRSAEENRLLRMFVGDVVQRELRDGQGTWDDRASHRCRCTVLSLAFRLVSDTEPEPVEPPGEPKGAASVSQKLRLDWLRQLNANLQMFLPELKAYGGQVEAMTNDSLLVVFLGERHERTALQAATSIMNQQQALMARAPDWPGFGVGIVAGLATGSVQRGAMGSRASGCMGYGSVGPAVDRALRLQLRGRSGQVLLGADLVQRLGDGVRVRPAGVPVQTDAKPTAFVVESWADPLAES